jgi:hypothetical protein
VTISTFRFACVWLAETIKQTPIEMWAMRAVVVATILGLLYSWAFYPRPCLPANFLQETKGPQACVRAPLGKALFPARRR